MIRHGVDKNVELKRLNDHIQQMIQQNKKISHDILQDRNTLVDMVKSEETGRWIEKKIKESKVMEDGF